MTRDAKSFITRTNSTPKSVVDSPLKTDAEIHILVGGPYVKNGEEHRYGHTAVRLKSKNYDLTYDFGRYGRQAGIFGESGEGILRVWNSFSSYISGEISLKRKTTGFIYYVFSNQTDRCKVFFDEKLSQSSKFGVSNNARTSFKLSTDYHALGPNCTTISIDGAKQGIPRIDENSVKFIKPNDVLDTKEMLALKLSGGATRIFLPANLLEYLSKGCPVKIDRIDNY